MPLSLQKPLINVSMDSWYYDGAVAKLANKGSLAGTVQLGDGVTPATFPSQIMPHGMSFNGVGNYLLRSETAGELTFTDPAPFSVELLVRRDPLVINTYDVFVCKSGSAAGLTMPFLLYLRNDAGTLRIAWGSGSNVGALRGIVEVPLGAYWPQDIVAHVVPLYDGTAWRVYVNGVQAAAAVALGCYAPSDANQGLYVGTEHVVGVNTHYAAGRIYNFAVYPFALQPGEVAQLNALRRGLLNRGF